MINLMEKTLKGSLKGKWSVTQALLVTFLITGTISQGAPEKARDEKDIVFFIDGDYQNSEGSGSDKTAKVLLEDVNPESPGIRPPGDDGREPGGGGEQEDGGNQGGDPDYDGTPSETLPPGDDGKEPGISIWEDGNEITGRTYTLTSDLTTSENHGLRTSGSEVINESIITITGGNKFGMVAEDNGKAINNGIIDSKFGMYSFNENSEILNNGLIKSSIFSENIGMQTYGNGSAINSTTGIIETTGIGMRSNSGSKITNKGTINVSDGGTGMISIG